MAALAARIDRDLVRQWMPVITLVALALIVFAIAAWRFELGRRPSVADHPHAPEMPPPGQVRVAPIEEDDDTYNPPRH